MKIGIKFLSAALPFLRSIIFITSYLKEENSYLIEQHFLRVVINLMEQVNDIILYGGAS